MRHRRLGISHSHTAAYSLAAYYASTRKTKARPTVLYLPTQGHPGTYEISLSKRHILANIVCTMAKEMSAPPRWQIEDSIIEAGTMIIAYQEQPMLDDVLENRSWKGRANFYKENTFLRPVRAKGIAAKKQRSLSGWLSLCSQASESDPHEVVESILQPERPRESKDISSSMQRKPRTTAWDLRIQHPVVQRRYPNHGGDIARVGPLATN